MQDDTLQVGQQFSGLIEEQAKPGSGSCVGRPFYAQIWTVSDVPSVRSTSTRMLIFITPPLLRSQILPPLLPAPQCPLSVVRVCPLSVIVMARLPLSRLRSISRDELLTTCAREAARQTLKSAQSSPTYSNPCSKYRPTSASRLPSALRLVALAGTNLVEQAQMIGHPVGEQPVAARRQHQPAAFGFALPQPCRRGLVVGQGRYVDP